MQSREPVVMAVYEKLGGKSMFGAEIACRIATSSSIIATRTSRVLGSYGSSRSS